MPKNQYWTAFAYKSRDPIQVHCTHKFFGPLSPTQNETIKSTIDEFFAAYRPGKFTIRFDTVERFGPYRVLVSSNEKLAMHLLEPFHMLRRELDRYRVDDFSYTPHITTPTWNLAELPFTRYVYCVDDEILQSWELC